MESLQSLIAIYGPAVIFAGTFLEGETIVVVAGFLAHQGDLDPFVVAACAFLGSFLGDQVWFYIGRHFSTFRPVRAIMAKPIFGKALSMIEAHPRKFILTFRFVYGIRNVSPVAIGISAVPSRQYFVFNAIAAIVWAGTFTTAGYYFGTAIETFFGSVHAIEQKILFGAAIAVGVYVAFHLGWRLWRWVNGNGNGNDNRGGQPEPEA